MDDIKLFYLVLLHFNEIGFYSKIYSTYEKEENMLYLITEES